MAQQEQGLVIYDNDGDIILDDKEYTTQVFDTQLVQTSDEWPERVYMLSHFLSKPEINFWLISDEIDICASNIYINYIVKDWLPGNGVVDSIQRPNIWPQYKHDRNNDIKLYWGFY